MLKYQLVRSAKRKTLGLQVKQGEIIVRAPHFLTEKQIHRFVNEKSAWLLSKVDQQNSVPTIEPMSFTSGSLIWVGGEQKKLSVTFQSVAQVINLKDEIKVILPLKKRKADNDVSSAQYLKDAVRKQLEDWFKVEMNRYLTIRLAQLSTKTQLVPKSFIVKRYKARWGSCNSRGELSFNYLLMMVPSWVIDYVIVHELCHLKHLNHSAAFWRLVALHDANADQAKYWLKTHQRQLVW